MFVFEHSYNSKAYTDKRVCRTCGHHRFDICVFENGDGHLKCRFCNQTVQLGGVAMAVGHLFHELLQREPPCPTAST